MEYTATITFRGESNATVEYPEFPCGGALRATGQEIVFREHINWGRGWANGGTLRLIRKGHTLLFKRSQMPSGAIIAAGTLSCVQ